MAFSLPSVKVKPEFTPKSNIVEGPFGVPEVMKLGFASVKQSHEIAHPLVISEANYRKNQERMNMTVLRNTQGLHAPLRLQMELKAVSKVGRLPFLPSSNLARDVLLGRDIEIDFEDVLNVSEFQEVSGQPHAMIEKSLGIL